MDSVLEGMENAAFNINYLSEMIRKRKYWIDALKVFAILLVVLGHVPTKNAVVSGSLYAFHMPLFFILSGYLARKQNSIKEALHKSWIQLMVPYILYVIIGIIIDRIINNYYEIFIDEILLGMPSGGVSPIWFVFVLFFIKILEANRMVVGLLFFGLALLHYLFIEIMGREMLPTLLAWFVNGYSFYYIGKYFDGFSGKLENTSKYLYWVVCIAFCSMPLIGVEFNGYVDMYHCLYARSAVLYYIIGIASSYGLMMLFQKLFNQKNIVITTLSTGMIAIVALHKYLLYLYVIPHSTIIDILVSIVVVLGFYYPIILIKKYTPILIGNRKV